MFDESVAHNCCDCPAKEPMLMLAHLAPSTVLSIGLLVICLFLVLAFEATNGFHDAANAVATVIYTNWRWCCPAS
jgi:PiT family inorganic phosphate transporter